MKNSRPVPHTPTLSTSTTTWPGLATGGSTSCTSDSRGPVITNAFIREDPSSRADHPLALSAQTVDAERDHISRPQPDRWGHPQANAGRCAGVDQVAGLQHQELAQVVHDEERIEDHRGGRSGLPPDPGWSLRTRSTTCWTWECGWTSTGSAG